MPRPEHLSLSLVILLAGCLATPVVPSPSPSADASDDAAVAPGSPGLVVTLGGEDGRSWPSTGAPRRPVFVVTGAGLLEGATEPVLLFEGAPDAALLDDLERPPLLVAHAVRRVALTVVRDAEGVHARPEAPLALGGTYTFAIGAWAVGADGLGVPTVTAFPFTVARTSAGAVLAEVFPPAASAGVDPSLPFVALRFDDDVSGTETIGLDSADGRHVETAVASVPCVDIGFDEGRCVILSPTGPLVPSTEHRVVVPGTVVDRTGAPIGPIRTAFTTGEGPPPPLVLALPTCSVDERASDSTCVLEQDAGVRVRGRASGPVRAFLELAGTRVGHVAARGDFVLVMSSLGSGSRFEGRLRLIDLSGRITDMPLALETTPPLVDIVIAEIRADALGPEPAQEYVELWNRSDAPIDLGGFRLSDRADLAGDALPSPSFLPAHGRALVVADAFDPVHPADPQVAPGIPLFRIGSSLGASGLANTGEPLFLRDSGGRRVAEAPAIAPPGAGHCVVRVAGTSRLPEDGDYGPAPEPSCSPGLP